MRILRVGVTPLGTVTGVDIRIAFPSGVNVLPLLQNAVMAMLNGTELDGFALNTAPTPQAPAATPPAAEVPTTAQEPPVAVAPGASVVVAPEPRRRRAHQNPLGETAPAATEPPAQAPATSRRRRAPARETIQAPILPAQPAQYPDLELSKAASEAAAVLSPAAVTEFLRSFNVQWVGQLKAEQRGKFVIGLQEKMKLAQAHAAGAAE